MRGLDVITPRQIRNCARQVHASRAMIGTCRQIHLTHRHQHQPTRLRAGRVQPAGLEGFDFIERLFEKIARDYLGFGWRHTPFTRLRDKVNLDDIWVVWENKTPVGYVFARKDGSLLQINVQALRSGIDAIEAVAAVVSEIIAPYVQVTMSHPSDVISFQRAGWYVAHPNWNAFMIKPLVPEVTTEDARRLFGIGTDRFLISWLDVT